MNFPLLLRAFDAALTLGDAVKRLRKGEAPPPDSTEAVLRPTGGDRASTQLEARLTNVVVAALKEAFDRDHARLELERAHIEEQRRRADEALRLERRRQAIEGELSRVRLLAGAALVGWIASILMMSTRLDTASSLSRAMLGSGWIVLVGACGAAFGAQRYLSAALLDGRSPETRWAGAALGLFVVGLALVTVSLLL